MLNPIYYGSNLGSADTSRGPSKSIWNKFPTMEVIADPNRGFHFFDDFIDFGLPGTQTTEINLGRYKVYNTGATKVAQASVLNSVETADGMISITTDTAGDQGVIGTHACPILLSTTTRGPMFFEARVATTSVATNDGQLFVGLCENDAVTFGAAIPLADANATASTPAMVGFNRLEDGLRVLNTSYADHSATWTDVQASAGTFSATEFTFIKLGMIFDPDNSARCLRFFVDGIECSTAMTKAALLATTYLDAVCLGPCAAVFADSGAAAALHMDWWRFGQLTRS